MTSMTNETRAPKEVVKPKKRRFKVPRKVWLPLAVLSAILFFASRGRRAAPPKDVKTAKVTRQLVTRTASATGKIQPFTIVDVKAKASGTVIKMAVEEGSRVKAGQLICLLDRRDTLASFRQAQADVQSAQAALSGARANRDLQRAALGPQIEQARENVSGAQARLASATSALAQQRLTLDAQIEEARAGVASAQARLQSARDEAQAQPQLSLAGVRSARATVASAQAGLRAAQQSARQLETSTLPQSEAQARASLREANSNLDVATKNAARQKTLLDRGFIAANAYDAAQNQQELAQAALDSAQVRLDTLRAEQESQRLDAQSKVQTARAQLAGANASLQQAQASQVQDRLKRSDVQSAVAALRQSQASLQTALANRAQIAQRQADLRAEASNVRAGAAGLRVAQTGVLTTRARQADVSAQEAQLAKALEEARARARSLSQTTVLAPRDGIVLQKYVDTGAIIQSGESGFSGGTSIVQLADTARVYVDAQVDESDIADIKPGQRVQISLDAYPDKAFNGRVRKIFPQAQVDNNVTVVKVQVEVLNSDARLRPNLNATCDFQLSSQNALSVPIDALRDEGKQTFVRVVKDKSKPAGDLANQEKRLVIVGTRGDERASISRGLKEGETIIVPEEAATPGDESPFG